MGNYEQIFDFWIGEALFKKSWYSEIGLWHRNEKGTFILKESDYPLWRPYSFPYQNALLIHFLCCHG